MASTLQTGDQFIVSRSNSTYKTTIDNIKEFIGSGGSEVIVSETAPDPADYPAGTGGVLTEGTLWWDSTEGDLFVLYDDNGSLIWVDATNHSNSDDRDVIINDNEPVADFKGQIWVNTSECPPTLNVWDGDCDGGGGSWTPIEGGSSSGLVQLGVAIISSGDPDNYVGSVLTATGGEGFGSTGGILPPSYSWTRDNVTIPSFRGTTVTADVEGTYEVTATVVDPNTSEVSTRTADILINELPGVIVKPTILSPEDGAGSGDQRYLISDAITEVEGGGVDTCETDPIQSVDQAAIYWEPSQGIQSFTDQDVTAWFTVKNITAVTGFRIENNETLGYTTEFRQFIVNGTDLKNSDHPVTTSTGTAYSNSTPENWQDSNVTANAVQGQNSEIEWTIPPLAITGAVTVTVAGTRSNIWVKDQNGEEHVLFGSGGSITLTFSSSKDLACFADGDVVQSYVKSTILHVVSEPDNNPSEDGNKFIVYGYSELDMTSTAAQDITNPANAVPKGYEGKQLVFDLLNSSGDFNFASDTTGWSYFSSVDGINWLYEGIVDPPSSAPGVSIRSLFVRQPNARYACVGGLLRKSDWDGRFQVQFNQDFVDTYTSGRFSPSQLPTDDEYKFFTVVGEPDTDNNSIVVSGGSWKGTDGTGDQIEGQTQLYKETFYDTKLTVAGPKDLADMTGSTVMTDGTGAPGPYSQTPYKLVTTDIESVDNTDPDAIELTFPGDVSTNPDLRYFKQGDVVQQTEGHEGLRINGVNLQSTIESFYPNIGRTEYAFTTLESIKWRTNTAGIEQPSVLGVEVKFNGKWIRLIDPRYKTQDSPETDPGFNHEQNWTDDVTGPQYDFAYPPQYFFDGTVDDLSYRAAAATDNDQEFRPATPITGITGIAVYTYSFGTAVDDIYKYSVISTGYPDSNTMTVDGGDWGGEGTISYNSANGSNAIDPNNIFDGNENTFGTFTVDGSFIGFDSTGNNLRVKFILDKLHPDHKIYVQPKVNGGWTNSGTFDYNGLNYIDFDGVAAGTEIDTVFTMPDGYDGEARLNASGGNTLKDSTRISIYSSYSAGDTHVEYQTNGGEGEIVSVNTDDNTILLSNTGDRDNRWIAENKAATDFYVAGPSKVDEPLLTADVFLESTPLTTEPEDGLVIDKKYVWKLNGAVQETDQNPFKPALSLNTTYTVSCVHKDGQGRLDDSEESGSITFTTGAARNAFEYQQNIITELRSRLSSLEADEINDDATDTLLISTIADLINRVETLESGN